MRNPPGLIVLFLTLTFGSVTAQSPVKKTELVLHCRDLNPAQVERIGKQLKSLEGVHLAGYYLPAQCLFITYDEKKVAKTSIVANVLYGLNKKARDVKGYTIYDIIDKGLPPGYLQENGQASVDPE